MIRSPAEPCRDAARAMVGLQRSARSAPSFVDLSASQAVAPVQELAAALSRPVATIPPKFFYDSLGSTLFAAICELPEYYPTRTERALLASHCSAIAQAVGTGGTLIDLGAGDCRKAE